MIHFFQKNKGPLSNQLLKIKENLKKKRIIKNTLSLSSEDKATLQDIKEQTTILNLNNVTRTKAYFDFYKRHPEIHWSFLAHMVSRNAGWNLTDLKGSFLTRLLTKNEATAFFEFLERGNWLIFQDAFPQLLVYEKSIVRGKNLFYLLPHLSVSFFMEILWNQFWDERNSFILTTAQIINEQNHLEKELLISKNVKNKVLDTMEFKIQDLLSMNHILFPFLKNDQVSLIGHTIHHFESLHKRIVIGKLLYTILFNHDRLNLVVEWANKNTHTGSRKDYWPHLFNNVNESVPGNLVNPKMKDCLLIAGSPKIYSPKLEIAWKNIEQKAPAYGDWYKNWKVIYYLNATNDHPINDEIESAYCETLERLELAVTIKKTISHLY